MMEGSSTGLFLLMNDNKVYNSVFFCSMRGIFNGGSVNWFEDIHSECRNGRLGPLTVAATLTRPFCEQSTT